MRYSDRPILRPDQDLLGRNGFALELARAIDQLQVAGDGFVMAILGGWGSGKSSIIELVIRYLRHLEIERDSGTVLLGDEQVQVLNLDQIEQMAIIFEKVEGHVLSLVRMNRDVTKWDRDTSYNDFRRRLGTDEEAAAAHRYWRLKLRVDAAPRTSVVRFSPWLIAGRSELAFALLSDLARSAGESFGEDIRTAFASLLTRLAELAPIAGATANLTTGLPLGSLFAGAGTLSSKVAASLSKGPTLDEVRDRLRAALARLKGQQILVIIDDLDRLTPHEALEMVALVKSLGDLPNVIYLLGYDEEKLSDLVKIAIQSDGREFLEKIIQYSITLPPIDSDDLTRMLDSDLSALLGDLSAEEQRRLGGTWYFIFRHYLESPRDIRRYINAVAVRLSALAGRADRIDILILELLHMFEPEVYWWVRRNLSEVTE